MMETADQVSTSVCPECEWRYPSTEMISCSVCGKEACHGCLEACDCGCEKRMHRRACSAVWEKNQYGSEYWWRKECLLDHANKLEADAHESIIEAGRARQLAAGMKA